MTIQFDEEKQDKKIDDLRKKEEEDFIQIAATKQNAQYVDLSQTPIETDSLRLIGEHVAREAGLAAFRLVDKKVHVAVSDSPNEKTNTVFKDLETRGYIIIPYLASHESLRRAWDKYKELSYAFETKAGSLDISNEEITDFLKKVHTIEDVKALIVGVLEQNKSYKITRIVEIILAGALSINASDIHIEPEEKYVRLRYRLDGVLNDVLQFDSDTFKLVLSRIKLLSGLKINVKSDAQDGRFSVKINESDIEIRTSILPGAYSESIVLRVLNPKSIGIPLEELGINPKLLKLIEHEIEKPNGMILTTGPTGSGKTTTLYAFLKKVHNSEIKIITIENPIEYHLPGIVQTQTDTEKGYTFLQGLRSALRQDPDVIMVGEIRDNETAEIAINAALTGHLVFSTLHTNNAAGSFPRLVDLGVNAKIITSALNIAMAQRLIRKLCVECKKEVPLEGETKDIIVRIMSTVKDPLDRIEAKTMWEPVGCVKCNFTGFKGRIGLYEAILTDENIEKIVKDNPSERELKKAAIDQGILTLKQDGIIKTLKGITSLTELKRVVDLEEIEG